MTQTQDERDRAEAKEYPWTKNPIGMLVIKKEALTEGYLDGLKSERARMAPVMEAADELAKAVENSEDRDVLGSLSAAYLAARGLEK